MEQVQGWGRVLPSLLKDAIEQDQDLPRFYQWQKRKWQGTSAQQLTQASTELALGLQCIGLESQDKIAFLLPSDLNFIVADFGTLLAGLVNVPIDLTQTIENIIYILNHAQVKALIVANLSILDQILPYLGRSTSLRWLIVVDNAENLELRVTNSEELKSLHPNASVCLKIPSLLGETIEPVSSLEIPECLQLVSLEQVQEQGRRHLMSDSLTQLLKPLKSENLATIIYIAGDNRQPNGVMLTHENIVTNVLTAFKSFRGINQDSSEIVLSFLPLTHIFARSFFYGHLSSGHQIYFSNANHLMRHLQIVKPTILITVPLLLEKIYHKIVQKGDKLKSWQKWLFKIALGLAEDYRIDQFNLPHQLISQAVFKDVSSLFGGNLKALICGGAGLNPSLGNIFMAMGIPLVQGYGLTETSGVVAYTQTKSENCSLTVGTPITGVSLKIAKDGEILIKSPFTTHGYYQNSELSNKVLDEQGWLHTGDLGLISANGSLQITGIKKAHFKLSTGKYVSALPLETQIQASPLINRAIALAPNYKFCSMLIFPDIDNLRQEAEKMELDGDVTIEELLQNSCILALYQKLIDQTNCHLPYWSHVRKFRLINYDPQELTDSEIIQLFKPEIEDIYQKSSKKDHNSAEISSMCPVVEVYSCPAYAQSMNN